MNQTFLSLTTAVTEASAVAQALGERIEAELAFADELCHLHADHAAAWRPLIQQARARVRGALSRSEFGSLSAVVSAAEHDLGPLAATAKSYVVHCIGHGHIDMNWMWSWPETVSITIDTFGTVLRLMDEYPGFCYSQSQASTYAILDRHRPDLLAQIARRVREGRWEVTASHWVEGDKNLAGGESLCRHLLYTRRYFRHLFGLKPAEVPIDWSPDTFGHAATVPSYLVRGGVKYLYLHRPGVQTPSKPGAFWWEGPDGSRVLVRNDMELGYNGAITPQFLPHLLKFVKLTGGRDYMFVFGVGDHGGGPTRRDILRAVEMNTWPLLPQIRFSTARAFYAALEQRAASLPVIRGELNMEFTGCYTTQTLIKKDNRFAENRLADAEAACALAWAGTRLAYPTALLEEGWRDTLFSHFHDILPGSGVHDTRAYTHGLYQKTMAASASAEVHALRRLAARVNTTAAGQPGLGDGPAARVASGLGAGAGYNSAEGNFPAAEQSAGHGPRPLVIFNPTAQDRTEIVEAVIWDNAPGTTPPLRNRAFSVRHPDGSIGPVQILTGGGYWGHDFVTLAFPATVPGLGYAQYTVLEAAVPSPVAAETAGKGQPVRADAAGQIGWRHHCLYAPAERSSEGLENHLLRIEIDTATGALRQLVDKARGLDLLAPATGTAGLEYAVERPHGMTAWSIDHTGPTESPVLTALRRSQSGPYKASLEADFRIQESTFTLTYEVRAGDPKLYLHLRGTWFQRGTPQTGVPVLNLALPLALANAKARYEIAFGAIDRDLNHHEEVPALSWAQVSGNQNGQAAGCLLINDSKHGHSLDGSTLRLTLIRSSYDPDLLPEIGQHEVHLALRPFTGELSLPDAIHDGQQLNHALRVVGTDVHAGPWPGTGQFIRITPAAAVLSVVKKTEDGNSLLVRLYNPTAKSVPARIVIDSQLLGEPVRVQELDLLEAPLKNSTAKLVNRVVAVSLPAHGITTVSVRLQPGKRP